MADELTLLSQLGKRITYLRKERGISQLELSIDSGLSKSYLSDLEHGRRNPSVASLSKIASALGVTLEELFRGVVEIRQLIDN